MLNIRIANPPENLINLFSEKSRKFYCEYADLVLKIFNNNKTINFLKELCSKECLKISNNLDIRIMIFPAQCWSENDENNLKGKCNLNKSQVSIYPVFVYKKNIIPDWLNIEDKNVRDYIIMESIKILLHELLHQKYNEDFMKIRSLNVEEIESIVETKSVVYSSIILRNMNII